MHPDTINCVFLGMRIHVNTNKLIPSHAIYRQTSIRARRYGSKKLSTCSDRERRTGLLLGAQVRPDARTNPESDARGPGGQPPEPRRDGTDTEALSVSSRDPPEPKPPMWRLVLLIS